MTKHAGLVLWVFCLTMTFAGGAAAQKTARLAGTWDVHIEHLTGRVVNEQWVVEQDGNKVTGKVKTARRDFPLQGTVDGSKIDIKVTVSEDNYNIFTGTVEGDSIKGSVRLIGRPGDDPGTFSARRASS